ncbi:MAG: hypothetical protein CL763_08290 [Chloroflexi bacterium]|nr:hypothetical protein [Chloroflexota bacterium]|tara:strand:- start:12052 stop:12759 length:708 start_codon:yes stop_codon:yes gene_type:complete
MTTVGIHQPEYLPWLGFFKKIMNSELFVLLDDAQFRKKGWQNRNRIRIKNGTTLLSIPVHAHSYPKINEVTIDNEKNWSFRHQKSILSNYANAPFFDEIKDVIESIFNKNFEYLVELNTEIIKLIMNVLNIKTKVCFSSELHILKKGSDRVLDICKAVDAKNYITGTFWAESNLQIEEFQKANINVEFQKFQHPTYNQIHGKFVPEMSIIDLLFNEGKSNAKKILHDSSVDSRNA